MPNISGKAVERLLKSLVKTAGLLPSQNIFSFSPWINAAFVPAFYPHPSTGLGTKPQDIKLGFFTVSTNIIKETSYLKER